MVVNFKRGWFLPGGKRNLLARVNFNTSHSIFQRIIFLEQFFASPINVAYRQSTCTILYSPARVALQRNCLAAPPLIQHVRLESKYCATVRLYGCVNRLQIPLFEPGISNSFRSKTLSSIPRIPRSGGAQRTPCSSGRRWRPRDTRMYRSRTSPNHGRMDLRSTRLSTDTDQTWSISTAWRLTDLSPAILLT